MNNERTINAFPASVNEERISGQEPYTDPGMSLRDYFAAKAMAGILMDWTEVVRSIALDDQSTEARVAWLAKRSYEIADAMLKARENV